MRIPAAILTAVVILGGTPGLPAAPLPSGVYRFESEEQDCRFEVRIPRGRPGQPLVVPFTARSLSGRGPAVSGTLRGIARKDLWTVTFEDDFGNAGRGTLRFQPGLLFLTLTLEQVEEPRCARYYGSMRLVKEET